MPNRDPINRPTGLTNAAPPTDSATPPEIVVVSPGVPIAIPIPDADRKRPYTCYSCDCPRCYSDTPMTVSEIADMRVSYERVTEQLAGTQERFLAQERILSNVKSARAYAVSWNGDLAQSLRAEADKLASARDEIRALRAQLDRDYSTPVEREWVPAPDFDAVVHELAEEKSLTADLRAKIAELERDAALESGGDSDETAVFSSRLYQAEVTITVLDDHLREYQRVYSKIQRQLDKLTPLVAAP